MGSGRWVPEGAASRPGWRATIRRRLAVPTTLTLGLVLALTTAGSAVQSTSPAGPARVVAAGAGPAVVGDPTLFLAGPAPSPDLEAAPPVAPVSAASPVVAGRDAASRPGSALPSGPVPVAAGAAPAVRPAPVLPAAERPRPEPNRVAPGEASTESTPGAVWTGDFPDPFVIRTGGVYYAYSTELGVNAVPTIRSLDLVHWQTVGDALPRLPAWSSGFDVWAPAVIPTGGAYVMFYTIKEGRTGDQCISRAVSAVPQGPFVDGSVGPFVCQFDQGGDIDPSPFVDADGTDWLIFKSEGTVSGKPTRIWAQQVTANWSMLAGRPVPLLTADQGWEGGVVEAPDMLRQGSTYYLFYSGNNWDSGRYAIGYAVCRSVTGPCRKPRNGPVLASHANEMGPGSGTLFFDVTGRLRMAFHAWTSGRLGYPGGARSLHIGAVGLLGDRVSVSG